MGNFEETKSWIRDVRTSYDNAYEYMKALKNLAKLKNNHGHSNLSKYEREKLIEYMKKQVIKKGYKLVNIDTIKNDKDTKVDMEKINKMLLHNSYSEDRYQEAYEENWKLYGHNELQCANFNPINNNKILKNYPSTFDYFVKQLEKNAGIKYEKVSIITNDTANEYDYNEGYSRDEWWEVYGLTILAPSNIAKKLQNNEKCFREYYDVLQYLKRHPEIIVLYSGWICYYEEHGWEGVDFKKPIQREKLTEAYREQAREKLARKTESNQIEYNKLFDIFEGEYGIAGMPIVGELPIKEIAYAAFDTYLYAAKLEEKVKQKDDKEIE